MLVIFFTAEAQQNPIKDEGKRKTGINKPAGNPGDPTNALTGKQQGNQNQPEAQSEEERSLLGDDNDKAEIKKGNSRENYRRNRVSGNPNNRNAGEGSNRRSVSGETGESSTSTPATMEGDTASEEGESVRATGKGESQAGNNNQSANVPSINQVSTSGSGSPAILSENDGTGRDGTNNVQRATPNMAGSPVGDLSTKKKNVDPDKEIREGTSRQQRDPSGNDISNNRQGQTLKKASTNGKTTNEIKPENKDQATSATDGEEDLSTKAPSDPVVTHDGNSSGDKRSQRKEKRKKRKNRD